MIGPGSAGSTLEAVAEGFLTGLVGTLGITIDDNEGNNVVARTTANIAEIQTVGAYGVYRYLGTFPAQIGTYTITWDDGVITASEYIEVSDAPPEPDSSLTPGPCSAWVEAIDVAECCALELSSDIEEALEAAAEAASGVLFELSGAIFRGECGPVTVRPCSTRNLCFSYIHPGERVRSCGCRGLSEVLLPGYPVTAIAEVLIDGVAQPPSEYRLDGNRKLVRLADAYGKAQDWPSCQRLDLADTEENTFAVTYYYGVAPPALATRAAAQLACELYRACSSEGGECALPTGTVRVTRQGVTVERAELATFLSGGQTGLVQVDAFLAAYGLGGPRRRRPAIWSPDGPRYAQRLG